MSKQGHCEREKMSRLGQALGVFWMGKPGDIITDDIQEK